MKNKKKKAAEEFGSSEAEERRLSRGRTRPDATFPVAPAAASLPDSYTTTLQEIKTYLRSARVRAVLAANPIVIEAYWQTGKIILARQQEAGWGRKSSIALQPTSRKHFRTWVGCLAEISFT